MKNYEIEIIKDDIFRLETQLQVLTVKAQIKDQIVLAPIQGVIENMKLFLKTKEKENIQTIPKGKEKVKQIIENARKKLETVNKESKSWKEYGEYIEGTLDVMEQLPIKEMIEDKIGKTGSIYRILRCKNDVNVLGRPYNIGIHYNVKTLEILNIHFNKLED